MNVDDGKKSRAALKGYFVKNAIPTEGQFAQFVDSGLNQRDDGLVKTAGDPLSVEAAGDDTSFKKALNFYTRFADADPAWTVSLRPRANPADPLTGRAALSINDAAGNSRLSIDAATGRIGIGIVGAAEPLEVNGRIKAGALMIGPWAPNPGAYVFVGTSGLDQSAARNYALLQSSAGDDLGRTFLNSPLDIRFRIGNADRMWLTGDGQLSVVGRVKTGALTIGPWPANPGGYVHFGTDSLDQGAAGNYALLQGATGGDLGRTFVNSPLDIHFRIGNSDRMVLTTEGLFLTNRLEVGGSDIYFTDPNHNHSGIANVLGHAAIENGANYQGLMILGRTISTNPIKRVVKLWDDVFIAGQLNGHGADLAEIYFSPTTLEPGDVVSLRPDRDQIAPSGEPFDQAVIGVISANPGVVLNSPPQQADRPTDDGAAYPVALCGRVTCKVTDEGGPIHRGDLLTSASLAGHAMRAQAAGPEGVFRSGTIIGKALGSHTAGVGVIDIFVMLH
jgi:hypothetical protein